MKKYITLATVILYTMLLLAGNSASTKAVPPADDASKVQPKEVTLAKDSQSDKWGEVAFNHETHSIKNYSPDGKTGIACVECHHTDQPKSALKPPYLTSEREVILTTAVLEDAKSGPVKTCRSCHLQAGDDSKTVPLATDSTTNKPIKLTNEIAYHMNCNVCHDSALKARPDLKAKGIPGTNDCGKCHKPLT